jgi:hypothetical protein
MRTGAQKPSGFDVSAIEHALHAASHGVLQQTPSTQNPLEHWVPTLHACPLPDCWQVPFWQE